MLTAEDILPAVERGIALQARELGVEAECESGVREHLAAACGGDVRKALNAVELLMTASRVREDVLTVTLEDARLGARYCMLNMLASLDAHLGDLNRILRVVKLLAFVSSAPDFCRQPDVVNGASQLLIDLWGEEGRHARSAIAVNTLPSNLSVEIEAIFELDTSRLSEKPLERKGSVCL